MCRVGVNYSNQEIKSPFHRVAVVGNGLCGAIASKALTDVGLACVYAKVSTLPTVMYGRKTAKAFLDRMPDSDTSDARWTTLALEETPLVTREGPFFRIEKKGLEDNLFGAVVFAFGCSMAGDAAKTTYGLTLYEEEQSCAGSQRIGFILDAGKGSHPHAALAAVAAALDIQKAGGAAYVFFKNIPVATRGGQLLYDEANKAGVCFIRYQDEEELIVKRVDAHAHGGPFIVHVKDSVAGQSIEVHCRRVYEVGCPDSAVIPDDIRAATNHDIDENGFLLSQSIHCGLGQSFSRGVFAVGGCAGTLDAGQTISQAYAVAAKARAWALRNSRMASAETMSVNDSCVRCLTCLRICPHSAISVNYAASRSRIAGFAAACAQCGVCISECPRKALDLLGFPEMGIQGFLDDIATASSTIFVVYGCERSTSDAIGKIALPEGAVFWAVPCAGRISESLLWDTLAAGVSGALVVGCHHGNCASRNGADWAANRVKEVLKKLRQSGVQSPLVSYATVSARQPVRLEALVHKFKKSLDEHGDALMTWSEIGQ